MTRSSHTIRILIPLKVRKKNGRPKILPPADCRAGHGAGVVAWKRASSPRFRNWPEPSVWPTRQSPATACISRGEVLQWLTCGREASAVSLYDLCVPAGETWPEQAERTFR